MLGNLFGKRKVSEPFLAVDIGTEVVKAIVFVIDYERGKGVIIGSGRATQEPGNMQNGVVSDIQAVLAVVHSAVSTAKDQANVKRVKKAILGIAGELVKGSTTTVHYERVESDIKIDPAELKNIVERVQDKAYERIVNEIQTELGRSIDVRLINASFSDILIDGYRIRNPIGFQGSDVCLSVFNAYAPVVHIGALETIADSLGVTLLNIAAEPYAIAMSIDIEDIEEFNSIFIDIGGGTTDIAVVRNGGLDGTRIFSLGGRAFTKRIAAEYGLGYRAAEEKKLAYSAGRLNPDEMETIRALFADDIDVWREGVHLSLESFSGKALPRSIYLCGGGSGLPDIRKALADPSWTEGLSFAQSPQIRYLQPRDVTGIEDESGMMKTPQDIAPMALVSLAVDLTLEEKTLADILRRTVRDMQ